MPPWRTKASGEPPQDCCAFISLQVRLANLRRPVEAYSRTGLIGPVQPPSLEIGTPVMFLAASLQRNTAIAAISSMLVYFPEGSFSMSSSRSACCSEMSVLACFHLDLFLDQWRQHPARADGIAGDAAAGGFQGDDLGQTLSTRASRRRIRPCSRKLPIRARMRR